MERNPASRDSSFNEAFEKLSTAIHREEYRSRIRIHPYATLFSGVAHFLDLGGLLSPTQHAALKTHIADARNHFGTDAELQAAVTRLDRLL